MWEPALLFVMAADCPLSARCGHSGKGRAYMLMVSNENASPAGYNITFTGGNAGITDPVEPHVFSAWASCTGNQVFFRSNKKMVCTSVAANGSDFQISSATIVGAVPGDCSSPLGSDSVIITLSQPLPVGNYSLIINTGSDGNTLLDICNREIPSGENVSFTVTQPQPIALDSIYVPPGCSPAFVDLAFKKGIKCSSVAANGSDFQFTGPQAVSVSVAPGACSSSSLTTRIRLLFTTPLVTGGNYQLILTTGSDGNTLLDECGLPVTVTSPLRFDVVSPLSAAFTTNNSASCRQDSVRFFHNGNNNTSSWMWNFGNGLTSTVQNPVLFFNTPGTKSVTLIVANSICADTSTQTVDVNGNLKAGFKIPPVICAGDTIPITNTSTGSISNWEWQMGDGNILNSHTPQGFRYQPIGYDMYYTIKLITANTVLSCSDTIKKVIQVLNNCLIKVPTAFTHNGDGKNDFLFPLNAVKALQLEFKVFNRVGQVVFPLKTGPAGGMEPGMVLHNHRVYMYGC
ncbi:MAG: gliding motility-associated C-terminal domain-containing protein [Chitinophagaceae bacterium]|nr:gliding motility-associated C-terminal domain-containing protein [Chitinophagaceae bacterium]